MELVNRVKYIVITEYLKENFKVSNWWRRRGVEIPFFSVSITRYFRSIKSFFLYNFDAQNFLAILIVGFIYLRQLYLRDFVISPSHNE